MKNMAKGKKWSNMKNMAKGKKWSNMIYSPPLNIIMNQIQNNQYQLFIKVNNRR